MVVVPPAVRLFILVSSRGGFGVDWLSNPWAGGLDLLEWSAPYELRKLTVSWTRTPTVGVVQDKDMCTFHFLNLTDGDPDATWIDADFLTVENAFNTFWAALDDDYPTTITLSEYAWRPDGPSFRPHGSAFSPTVRVVPKAAAGLGSASQQLPPQCATSVTEVTAATFQAFGVGVPGHVEGTGRTQIRNRWGRFYLPPTNISTCVGGRFTSTWCDRVSLAVQAFYNTCVAGDIIPVMYSPTTGNAWSITAVHVDDIVDVVRSRRYVTPVTRSPRAIDAP